MDSKTVFTGTSRGFQIYHTDPFAKIFSSDDGNVAIIEMLFSTSLVALILSPRHLVIQNTKARHFSSSRDINRAGDRMLTVLAEILYYLRAHFPIRCTCCEAESKATCCSFGGRDILV
jgi:hypothetical protein